MKIYTLGFTKKSAGTFFGLIKDNNVRTIVDVRVNNASQLAGFAKKDDLFFNGKFVWFDFETHFIEI